jgi:hypothetical protein
MLWHKEHWIVAIHIAVKFVLVPDRSVQLLLLLLQWVWNLLHLYPLTHWKSV